MTHFQTRHVFKEIFNFFETNTDGVGEMSEQERKVVLVLIAETPVSLNRYFFYLERRNKRLRVTDNISGKRYRTRISCDQIYHSS